MNVLIGCEESQEVTKAFRALKFDAYSCDLQPCSGGFPKYHFQENFYKIRYNWRWDLVISFPPCDHLAVSGARWFDEKRKDGTQAAAIKFFLDVWNYSDAVENPIGIMNSGNYIKKWFPILYEEGVSIGFPWKPSQIIQPWQFGHGEQKATCLWLKNLPLLKPTNIVSGREQRIYKLPPSEERAKIRSKTYPGIATAMAEQWGSYIVMKKYS